MYGSMPHFIVSHTFTVPTAYHDGRFSGAAGVCAGQGGRARGEDAGLVPRRPGHRRGHRIRASSLRSICAPQPTLPPTPFLVEPPALRRKGSVTAWRCLNGEPVESRGRNRATDVSQSPVWPSGVGRKADAEIDAALRSRRGSFAAVSYGFSGASCICCASAYAVG